MCLTLLIYNVTSSVASQHNPLEHITAKESNDMLNKQADQQKPITEHDQAELLGSLLRSEKTYLAHKKIMTVKIMSEFIILAGAITSFGSICFLPKLDLLVPPIKKLKQHNEGVFRMLVAGLLTTGIGLIIGISSPEDRQDDIEHTQKNIEQLKAVLAALQTKNSSAPEAAVETK